MRIEKIRQSGQQEEVLVTLEDGSVLTVTGQELLSFGLSPGLDLDEAALGDLRQAVAIKWSIDLGMEGMRREGSGKRERICLLATSSGEAPSKGTCPVIISKKTTPME